MRARNRQRTVSLCALGLVALASIAIACGSSDELSFGTNGKADGGTVDGSSPGPFNDAGVGPPLQANGVVIVHAARLPSFRLCFVSNPSALPAPHAVLMPDSNIVGVEVGSAVRVPPIPNAMGKVFAIDEERIRPLYKPGSSTGPTCESILQTYANDLIDLGSIDEDLSSGVHLLVVGGCQAAAEDPGASVARCGSTWAPGKGNVSVTTIPVTAYARGRANSLPLQLVQLSPAFGARAANRDVNLSFGVLDGGALDTVVSGDLPFGKLAPEQPTAIEYSPTEAPSYATTGFAVSIGGIRADGGADAGKADAGDAGSLSEIVVQQSLAEIGRLSSSREVPTEWFAATSSYVILLVGDDSADAGVRDRFHLLAVPVASREEGDGGEGAEIPSAPSPDGGVR